MKPGKLLQKHHFRCLGMSVHGMAKLERTMLSKNQWWNVVLVQALALLDIIVVMATHTCFSMLNQFTSYVHFIIIKQQDG